MRLFTLKETIREILTELNPAHEKHRRNQEMMKRLYKQKYGKEYQEKTQETQGDPQKIQLFHNVTKYLGSFMTLTDENKKVIWSKVSEMGSDTEYWMKSYMDMGEQGWKDVKEFILPGFQE